MVGLDLLSDCCTMREGLPGPLRCGRVHIPGLIDALGAPWRRCCASHLPMLPCEGTSGYESSPSPLVPLFPCCPFYTPCDSS